LPKQSRPKLEIGPLKFPNPQNGLENPYLSPLFFYKRPNYNYVTLDCTLRNQKKKAFQKDESFSNHMYGKMD